MLFPIGFTLLVMSLIVLIIGFIVDKIQNNEKKSFFDGNWFKIIKIMAFFGIIFIVFGLLI